MNAAYINNGYTTSYGNYGSFEYGNYGGASGFGGNGSLGVLPNAFNVPSAQLFPQDSVTLSGNGAANFNFGVQDVCDCQFGNGASQEAFVVPAGDQDNPYQNFNATAMELPGVQGQNPQQALLALLANLGFTPEMIQMLQGLGINVLDLIAEANGLEGLNGLQTGQDLVLPTTLPANSDAPSIVYLPAPNTQASGSGHSTRRHGNGNSASPAAAPAPAPAPAARPQTLNDEAKAAGYKNGVPLARPGVVNRF